MTRRQALLAVLAMMTNGVEAVEVQHMPGFFRVDLDKWRGVAVTFRGQRYVIAADELWAALKE